MDDFNFDDLMSGAADMMQGEIPDPFQDPPMAEPAFQGRAFGDMPDDAPPPPAAAAPPVDVAPMPMDQGMAFGSNPYSIPDLRNDRAGDLMEAALGQAGEKMGGSYFVSGGTDWGQPTEDDQGYRQGPLGGMSQLDARKTTDIGRSDIDMSGDFPTFRQYSMSGDQMVAKPLRDFNDLASMPSGSAPIRDQNGDYVLDDRGQRTYYNQPGIDFRSRIASRLTPTALENGQQVYYDPTNNLTYGSRDGQPGALLAGGLGLDGATRQQANYYGWVPTTDARGNPVYYDEASNRTFIRNRDGSAGRQILDVNRDPRYLDGSRAGGGQGGGGGFIRRDPPPPPTEREVPIYNFANGQSIDLGETGAFRTTENGQRVQLTEAEVAKRIAAQRAADQAALEAAGQAPMVDGPRSIGSTVYQGQQVQVQEQGGRYYLSGGGSRVEVPATLIQQLRAEGKMK